MAHLNPGVIITLALYSAVGNAKEQNKPQIGDISALLVKIKNKGIDIGDISLRRIAGGYYSDDVEMQIGHLLTSGYALQDKRIVLTKRGIKFCKEIIKETFKEDPGQVRKIARILNLDLAHLI